MTFLWLFCVKCRISIKYSICRFSFDVQHYRAVEQFSTGSFGSTRNRRIKDLSELSCAPLSLLDLSFPYVVPPANNSFERTRQGETGGARKRQSVQKCECPSWLCILKVRPYEWICQRRASSTLTTRLLGECRYCIDVCGNARGAIRRSSSDANDARTENRPTCIWKMNPKCKVPPNGNSKMSICSS
jgi:hypothetical protein